MPLSLTDLESQGYLRSFEDVREEVAERHALRIPDRIVNLSETIITENLNIRVPGFGILEMTPWAKIQIGNTLGISWDKWFGTARNILNSEEIQEELSRRFNRLPAMQRLIRARRHGEESARSDGVLEAFLSPQYEAIDDERVFQRLESRFAGEVDELSVLWHPTRSFGGRWGWEYGDDKVSHYVFLTGEERDLGPSQLPDPHVAGFILRNSEVGTASLTMDDFWLRLRHMSTFTVSVDNKRLLYRRHRKISDEGIDSLLTRAFDSLEGRHAEVMDAIIAARDIREEEPLETLEQVLAAGKQSSKFIESAQGIWEEEREHTRFALVQAITRAAQNTRDMERRGVQEQMAGRFLLVG